MRLAPVTVLVFIVILAAGSAAQPVCFVDAGIKDGTTLLIRDSIVNIPPEEVVETLSAVGSIGLVDVEWRRETWSHDSPDGVGDKMVEWSKFDHDEPFWTPESEKPRPAIGTCYRILRRPLADTVLSHCSDTIPLTSYEQNALRAKVATDIPELIFRIFSGKCLTDENKDHLVSNAAEVLKRRYVVNSDDMTYTISDVSLSWSESEIDGCIHVMIGWIEKTEARARNETYWTDEAVTLEADILVPTAHAVKLVKKSLVSLDSTDARSRPEASLRWRDERFIEIEWIESED